MPRRGLTPEQQASITQRRKRLQVKRSIGVHLGDCRTLLPTLLPDNSVDAVITDPPYELAFMAKDWDSAGVAFDQRVWRECLRVLKPGGHMLTFGGSRTWHRLACAIEDSGFEIRDSIAWLYGSGFPKSLDVSKAIDKAAGAERKVIGRHANPARNKAGGASLNMSVVGMPEIADITAPATDAAKQWAGWGTALKPAHEPIIVARKPLQGTVAQNVLEHGTGGLNVGATRVGNKTVKPTNYKSVGAQGAISYGRDGRDGHAGEKHETRESAGRWPTNVALDQDSAAELDRQSGASRYFPVFPFKYQAKAPARERVSHDGVNHPTVKPLELMRWLIKLVTPPGGIVLDPFAGSGTTGEAALMEGMRVVLIENEKTYIPLIEKRIERYTEAS